ncbi:MAG: RNA polymerase sigma factor [Chloroflexota bacterium]|nr:MAG: RNA polymerase sigma factor [Chloroflexota bacterium]
MTEFDELVKRCQRGERRAFNKLFRSYEGRIYRLAMSILQDEHDAEDAMQDVFLRVYLNVKDFRGQPSFATWLTAPVLNVCRDKLRRQKIRRAISLDWLHLTPSQGEPDIADIVHERQERQRLWMLVGKLEEKLRIPVVLVYQEGLSVQETALSLGLPLSTVYSQLNTARERLKAMQCNPAHLQAGELEQEQC